MLSEKPDRDLIDRVLRDVEGMNQLIARCLEVSRDFAEQDSVDLDLCDLLAEVAGEFAHSGVDIRGRKGPDCRVRVATAGAQAHPRRTWSTTRVRYGGGQPIDIEYRIESTAASRSACWIAARALPEEERDAVFRPFHRLEPSRSSRTGGSGLGLAIVRQLANANGWSVDLTPRAGGGTAACVRVPLTDASTLAAGAPRPAGTG